MSEKILVLAANLVVILIVAALLVGAAWGSDASVVALSRDNYSVTNTGNVDVIMKTDGITGMAVLGVSESIQAEREENVKAEQA